jgi:gluconokinase
MHTGRYVVMGVAGAGKTLIGSCLAATLGIEFVEGDEYHPPGNVAKMAAGIPLTDDDRAGWLAALAARIGDARRADRGLVVAASVLKREYRDVFRAADPAVRFILLVAPRPVIAERLEHRSGHYMPPSLLDSQLAILEPPGAGERAWIFDNTQDPDAIVREIAARVRADEASRRPRPAAGGDA